MGDQEAKSVVLVEGSDDLHSLGHLLLAHGIDLKAESSNKIPEIKVCGSVSQLLDLIGTTIKSRYSVAIVCDANGDYGARKAAVYDRLREAGIEISAGEPTPCVFAGPRADQKVGMWIMPDNKSPGALENFLAGLIPAEDPCWPYAQEACKEAKMLGAPFKEAHRSKAELHTWLAWQDEPGRPYGTAIKSTSFDSQQPEAKAFVDWVKVVFQL